MDNDQVVSLTGLKTSYDYRELSNLPDNSLSSYASKTRQKFSEIAKSFNDEENAEWLIRSYLALKYVLASTVLGTSAIHAEGENLQITLPYLNYYAMLNCARAFIFTLPCTNWKDKKSIEMTHQNIINTASDKLRRLDDSVSLKTKKRLMEGQQQRELFSYRFPSSGLKIFGKNIVSTDDAISTARLFAELAQFNLACFESSMKKHVKSSFDVGDHESLWALMQYETKTQSLIDDDDYHRVGYFLRKFDRPRELASLATHGLVEDFFGAWTNENDSSKGYDPDSDWSLLLDIL